KKYISWHGFWLVLSFPFFDGPHELKQTQLALDWIILFLASKKCLFLPYQRTYLLRMGEFQNMYGQHDAVKYHMST
ncbi:hypothetical protein ACJX0J_023098, partial [Zea mays]